MHVIDPDTGMLGAAPIVGGTISLAVGAGLAAVARGDSLVSVAFFGDGAHWRRVLYESLNLAALCRLPVLFVCETTSTDTPSDPRDQGFRGNRRVAEPFGVQGVRVDGSDVLRCPRCRGGGSDPRRAGGGPTFIEVRHVPAAGACRARRQHKERVPTSALRRSSKRWRKRDP
jgi:TPP-dependent pyruvate/acetoin dehydrogenase alpha subunit